MAYVGNQLSLIAASIENSGGNSAVLIGSDSIGTVTGANYISDGQKRGLVLGSNVWYFNGTTAYQCYVSAVQAFPQAGVTLTQIAGGGGGGNAIEPESGPSIKISAIAAATLPMGADDILTGLQGGANVNFTRLQVFTGQDGLAPGDFGDDLVFTAGNGNSAGDSGGSINLRAGVDGAFGGGGAYLNLFGTIGTAPDAGNFYLGGGVGSGLIGGLGIVAGGNAIGGHDGGPLHITGGNASGGGNGGDLFLQSGTGIGASDGSIRMLQIPASSSGLTSGAIWRDADDFLKIVP